jgi:hypothetical protein
MAFWDDANEEDGLPESPESYHVPHCCQSCRAGRTGDSMTSDTNQEREGGYHLLICSDTGGWVYRFGVCKNYRMYDGHQQ